MDWQSFLVGCGFLASLAGAVQFGWSQAMQFAEKLEHFDAGGDRSPVLGLRAIVGMWSG